MPAKTKRQKILAEQHRKFTLTTKPVVLGPTDQMPPISLTQVKSISTSDSLDFAPVRRDLTKTVVLGLSAILIEFIMYWLTIKR